MWVRLHEKGSKLHVVPAHHNAHAYILAAGIEADKKLPLFRSIGSDKRLSINRISRTDVLRMIQRRAVAAGLSRKIGCYTWRATGITAYLQNGGSLEHAMRIACPESAHGLTLTKWLDHTRTRNRPFRKYRSQAIKELRPHSCSRCIQYKPRIELRSVVSALSRQRCYAILPRRDD
ncbi:MAG: hypothetical protein SGI77_13790 [Pirellulaceae bacterium]|nr:hypothetical protein [Pirellulaceae bacterium]